MIINNFDKIFCINLEKRKDRRSTCEKIFSEKEINVEFIEAVDGRVIKDCKGLNPGAAGCCLSHKKIYEMMSRNRSWKSVLILEDDIEFHPNFKELFSKYYDYVPDDWKLLFFGGSHNEPPKPVNEYVQRLKKTFTTHCYAVKDTMVDALMERFSEENIFNMQADVHLHKMQKQFPCYGFKHHIAWQREGYSDIEQGHRDYTFLK